MSVAGLLIWLLVVALIVWVFTLIPLPQPIRTIIMVIVAVCVLIGLLDVLGLFGPAPLIRPVR